MPDYAACTQSECRRKGSCARYLMDWSYHQTVCEFDLENCVDYWRHDRAPFKCLSLKEAENRGNNEDRHTSATDN